MQSTTDLLERLRSHAALGSAPTDELKWLVANGAFRVFEKDEVIARPGDVINDLFVILSGHVVHHLERSYGIRKVAEWRGGDITGFLPYSRMGLASGITTAAERSEAVTLSKRWIEELPATCPELTAIMVHTMIDRARQFTSADLNDQRVLALAKVAASLAHELNNPASALIRCAKTLNTALGEQTGMEALRRARALDDRVFDALDQLVQACRRGGNEERDALERADRDQAMEETLAGTDLAPELLDVFADSGVAVEELKAVVDLLPAEAVSPVLGFVARNVMAERLGAEIDDGASRVYHLVEAVKRFTHMDQTLAVDAVDVNAGLRDAATMVSEKARGEGVDVVLELAPDLPAVTGVVEELNQMWYSLIDNAVDAAAPGGTVTVSSAANGTGAVTVDVHDDGPGISDEIRDRIFDPFFTTKPVGAGVGLGLEVVRRVLDQHRGTVELSSEPGATRFRIGLPS